MKIYQPMLFVGLGGTGCRVGAELERRLRQELCGPDGTALVSAGGGKARFQLPDCLQFVYADFSESELNGLPHMVAPQELVAGFGRTARATHGLLPRIPSSVDVTQMLRVSIPDEVETWLPPQQGEPKVVPLSNGAGQLPTVGRATLYSTLQQGLDTVLDPLHEAIDAIAKSGRDLKELGGRGITGCDVFVAFSVAGGTGAGIFYDYLHLIGEAFRSADLRAQIYPLVVMPSAFPDGKGGGRPANLNAARAVLDLFRLVDDQNVPKTQAMGQHDEDGPIAVHYPGGQRVELQRGVVQTAFLFSKTAGIGPEDLRRSIVSLVLSLIGTEASREVVRGVDDQPQSFADSFINGVTERASWAPSGIGHRGVSTSLVASMNVPVDELAELIAGRLLKQAVLQLTDPIRRAAGGPTDLVRRLFAESRIEPVWTRDRLAGPDDPVPAPKGPSGIANALSDRVGDIQDLLSDLDRKVSREAGELVARFNPRLGLFTLLKDADLFRLHRAVVGLRGAGQGEDVAADDPIATAGFVGMLNNRRNQPPRPDHLRNEPPRAGQIKGRLFGAVPPKWTDAAVLEVLDDQDDWHAWQARRIWHAQWKKEEPRWRPALDRFLRNLNAVVDAFEQHAANEPKQFRERTADLYRARTGVSYLLPPQSDLKYFYDDVLDRLMRHEGLDDNENEDGLVLRLVSAEQWKQALELGARRPADAVTYVKTLLEGRIKLLFTQAGSGGEQPLLPSLADLLAGASGDERAAAMISAEFKAQFAGALANLLPAAFTPQGNGPLRILISYPRTDDDGRARNYLNSELQLPHGDVRTDFRPASGLDSITVVLFRTSMSLGEVREVREVLQQWALALRSESQEDYLAWRQRTGWQDSWLASTREDRVHILHRLLCSMWNGDITQIGDGASPDKVVLRLPGRNQSVATLNLSTSDQELSSWASILQSYERWALLSPQRNTEEFVRQLMTARPGGPDRPAGPPAELYQWFVRELAPQQLGLLDELADELGERASGALAPAREFWADTLPAALDFAFPHGSATRRSLRELDESLRNRRARPVPDVHVPPPTRSAATPEEWGDPAGVARAGHRGRTESCGPSVRTNGRAAPEAWEPPVVTPRSGVPDVADRDRPAEAPGASRNGRAVADDWDETDTASDRWADPPAPDESDEDDGRPRRAEPAAGPAGRRTGGRSGRDRDWDAAEGEPYRDSGRSGGRSRSVDWDGDVEAGSR